jgi:hypothetical protein
VGRMNECKARELLDEVIELHIHLVLLREALLLDVVTYRLDMVEPAALVRNGA